MNISERTKQIFAANLEYLMEVTDTGIPVSQTELANEIGASQGAVSTWLLMKKFPRADKLRAIAKFFHVGVNDLTDENFIERHQKQTMREEVVEVLDALSLVETALKISNDDPFVHSEIFYNFVDMLTDGSTEKRQNFYKQAVTAGGGDEAITKLVSIAMNLNDAGKEKVIEYALDLVDHAKYSARILATGVLESDDE